MDRDKLICRCFKVNAGKIEDAIKEGATTLEEVQEKTNASTGCGGCASEVMELIEELKK